MAYEIEFMNLKSSKRSVRYIEAVEEAGENAEGKKAGDKRENGLWKLAVPRGFEPLSPP